MLLAYSIDFIQGESLQEDYSNDVERNGAEYGEISKAPIECRLILIKQCF